MTTSFPPINYPNKPVPPFSAPAPRNSFPGFFPDMWKNIKGKPYITVSSKGLANGLSEYFNDGADFGPDSLQADGSLTQTTGIMEAVNYSISSGTLQDGLYYTDNIIIRNGRYTINAKTLISPSVPIANLTIKGETQIGVQLYGGSDLSDYVFEIDTTSSNVGNIDGVNIEIDNMTNFTGVPLLSAQYNGTTMAFKNSLQSWNVGCNDMSGLANFVTSGLMNVILENCNTYFGGTYGALYSLNNSYVYLNAPQLGFGAYIEGSDMVEMPTFSINGGGDTTTPPTLFLGAGNYVINIGMMGANTQINVGASSQCRFLRIGSVTLNTGTDTLIVNSTTTTGTINALSIGNIFIQASSGTFTLAGSYVSIGGFKYNGFYTAGGILSGYNIVPSISANPPVSATVYQNTNPYAIEIDLPVYATTSGTAGYVTIAKGATSIPTAIGNQYVSGDTSSTATQIIRLSVPAGWYYSFTGSGVTFATATPFAE